jgi:hypothetical protein
MDTANIGNSPDCSALAERIKYLESDAAELRNQIHRSQIAATIWYRRCFGEDPAWEIAKDAIVGKAVALVKFWEENGGGNGAMSRAKEDALILAVKSLPNTEGQTTAKPLSAPLCSGFLK